MPRLPKRLKRKRPPMTRSKFYQRDGFLRGFLLEGHSGAGEAGRDIVCAAISSAAYMTANTLMDIMGCQVAVKETEGRMAVFVEAGDAARCQELLQGFRLHMEGLREQYPRYIFVETVEGECPAEYRKGRV